MNYCNFGKVFIARATKDLSAINWWNAQQNDKPNTSTPLYSENLSSNDRFFNYEQYISGYPKMVLEYTTYQQKQIRIQGFLSEKKYWINNNKKGEKKRFLDNFSLQNWVNMDETEKKMHTIEDCIPCNTIHFDI